MAHFPKPFFRPKKNRWYVQIDGKHANLGPDEAVAFTRYHEMMTERAKQPTASVPQPQDIAVAAVLDLFLEWRDKHKAPPHLQLEARIPAILR